MFILKYISHLVMSPKCAAKETIVALVNGMCFLFTIEMHTSVDCPDLCNVISKCGIPRAGVSNNNIEYIFPTMLNARISKKKEKKRFNMFRDHILPSYPTYLVYIICANVKDFVLHIHSRLKCGSQSFASFSSFHPKTL